MVIACYNGEDTIGLQLEALSKQKVSDCWELVFVDNRSTDHSVDIANTYKTLVPNLRIIGAVERQGQPYALNTGVIAAKGEKIILCDADDEVAEDWLESMSKALQAHDIVAAKIDTNRLNSPRVRQIRGNSQHPQEKGLMIYDYPPYLPHAAGASIGFKKHLFVEVNGFDEEFPALHDTDFCWKAQNIGYSLHFVSDAVVHYRFRSTIADNYKQAKWYAEYNVKLYKKYKKFGMPPIEWKKGFYNFFRLLGIRQIKRLAIKEQRGFYLWQLGWAFGRIIGSIKYKTLAF